MNSQLFLLSLGDFDLGDMLFYVISFILMIWLVKVFAWQPVMKIMHDRENKIADNIDSAAKSKEDAEKLVSQREEELAHSKREAIQIIDQAKKTGKEQSEQIIAQARVDAQDIQEKASADIERERKEAMSDVKNQIANLSIEVASKLIKQQLNVNDQKDLIDSYIKELDEDD